MRRLHQIVLIASTLALSWFAMMAVHEAGHVFGAFLTGGSVAKVILHPLMISRTDLSANPQPLFVVWVGPLFGVVAPLIVWGAAQTSGAPCWYLFRFFAGVCLIANGAYLGVGSFDHIGDAGDLLRHGAAIWRLWLFGALCVPAGIFLWHGLGVHFGRGESDGAVSIPTAYGCLIALIGTVALTALFGGE